MMVFLIYYINSLFDIDSEEEDIGDELLFPYRNAPPPQTRGPRPPILPPPDIITNERTQKNLLKNIIDSGPNLYYPSMDSSLMVFIKFKVSVNYKGRTKETKMK